MTIGCSPHLRHWAPIRKLHGSMVCQHLKAQTTSALQRKNNSIVCKRTGLYTVYSCESGHMYLCTCVFFFLHTELNGLVVQDQLTNYTTTFCPIISLRAIEAEQELPAGNSDVKAALHEEHRRLSALGLSQESHNEREDTVRGERKNGRLKTFMLILGCRILTYNFKGTFTDC